MNSRGQAALEYLMTYGWALIVIAIVVGVLVFIVATPTGSLQCTSSGPGKINVVSNNLATNVAVGGTDSLGTIVITNLTGGVAQYVSMSTDGTGFINATPNATYDGTVNLPVGNTPITILSNTKALGDNTSTATITIQYTDSAQLVQTASITCQGATVTMDA